MTFGVIQVLSETFWLFLHLFSKVLSNVQTSLRITEQMITNP